MAKTYNSSEKRVNILRRTAKEVRTYKVRMKILSTALGLLVLMSGLLYGVSALYMKTGSFTVSIDKYEMTKYGLTLSESQEMTHKTSHLNASIAESMTNIASESLPSNIDMIDGVHNGVNHIAYTFYVQNAGEVDISYDYQVMMSNVTHGIDEAIRLRLYVNGAPTPYAKTASDGTGPEPGTVPFYSSGIMVNGRVSDFAPGEITKMTVVIWIEGSDPDCVDRLIGGEMRISMKMNVVH